MNCPHCLIPLGALGVCVRCNRVLGQKAKPCAVCGVTGAHKKSCQELETLKARAVFVRDAERAVLKACEVAYEARQAIKDRERATRREWDVVFQSEKTLWTACERLVKVRGGK